MRKRTSPTKRSGDCYGLPFGSDSRRVLYVGQPDDVGEHSVLVLDTDDMPLVGLEHAGIDTYLAIHSGLLKSEQSAPLQARRAEHVRQTLAGNEALEYGNDVLFEEDGSPYRYVKGEGDGEPVVSVNPMTGARIAMRKVPLV